MIDNLDFQALKTNGIKVNYLYVCERKLWFFDRGIAMEFSSDKVLMGKLLNEYSYPAEEKREILIDNLIKIDIVGHEEIKEVKFSDRLAEASKIQILYYLYYLKQAGIEKRGVIKYPRIKKQEEIVLTSEGEKEVENALTNIYKILKMNKPPQIQRKPYCSRCAYYEFCWS
ncbi:MAG: CRISPR-associated protein Cas4 [Candidatus Omnitrophica bacterium]|nr:CRISPR-associated protein Cas4 [Candidatus Omnitrophota bacterium]